MLRLKDNLRDLLLVYQIEIEWYYFWLKILCNFVYWNNLAINPVEPWLLLCNRLPNEQHKYSCTKQKYESNFRTTKNQLIVFIFAPIKAEQFFCELDFINQYYFAYDAKGNFFYLALPMGIIYGQHQTIHCFHCFGRTLTKWSIDIRGEPI